MKTQLITFMFALSFSAFAQYGPADSLKQQENLSLTYSFEEYNRDITRYTRNAQIQTILGSALCITAAVLVVDYPWGELYGDKILTGMVFLTTGPIVLTHGLIQTGKIRRSHKRYTRQFDP